MSGTGFTRIQTNHGNIVEIKRDATKKGYDIAIDGKAVRHEDAKKPAPELLQALVNEYTKDGGRVTEWR